MLLLLVHFSVTRACLRMLNLLDEPVFGHRLFTHAVSHGSMDAEFPVMQALAWIGLLVWGLGIPLAAWLLLFSIRFNLGTSRNLLMFGFLYAGFAMGDPSNDKLAARGNEESEEESAAVQEWRKEKSLAQSKLADTPTGASKRPSESKHVSFSTSTDRDSPASQPRFLRKNVEWVEPVRALRLQTQPRSKRMGCRSVVAGNGFWFWEVVVLTRKVLINMAAVVVVEPFTQSAVMALLLFASLMLQLVCKPFQLRVMNHAEALSLGVLLLSVLAGLSTSQSGADSRVEGLDLAVSILMTVAHVCFLLLIAYIATKLWAAVVSTRWPQALEKLDMAMLRAKGVAEVTADTFSRRAQAIEHSALHGAPGTDRAGATWAAEQPMRTLSEAAGGRQRSRKVGHSNASHTREQSWCTPTIDVWNVWAWRVSVRESCCLAFCWPCEYGLGPGCAGLCFVGGCLPPALFSKFVLSSSKARYCAANCCGPFAVQMVQPVLQSAPAARDSSTDTVKDSPSPIPHPRSTHSKPIFASGETSQDSRLNVYESAQKEAMPRACSPGMAASSPPPGLARAASDEVEACQTSDVLEGPLAPSWSALTDSLASPAGSTAGSLGLVALHARPASAQGSSIVEEAGAIHEKEASRGLVLSAFDSWDSIDSDSTVDEPALAAWPIAPEPAATLPSFLSDESECDSGSREDSLRPQGDEAAVQAPSSSANPNLSLFESVGDDDV